MRISDWSSDVCSSDLQGRVGGAGGAEAGHRAQSVEPRVRHGPWPHRLRGHAARPHFQPPTHERLARCMTTAPIPQGYPAAQPFTPASYPGLAGKVVLNTGAGSGIGRAMAHAFARHGAKLMLLDIDTAALEQTRAQLREAFPGVEVHIVPASIADDVAVEQADRKSTRLNSRH